MNTHKSLDGPPSVFALVWFGMLIGVSFIATPVKFSAPTLDLPTALDVGRVTFHLFARIELALIIALATLIFIVRPARKLIIFSSLLLAAIVLAQNFWLIPELDTRVAAVISGAPKAPSSHHTIYVAGEILKLIILAFIAVVGRGSKSELASDKAQTSA